MTYVKVNGQQYEAEISGQMFDSKWDNRHSKEITLEGDFSTVNALFPDGVSWSIVYVEEHPTMSDPGSTEQITEYDNSEFCIRGDLTVHTDGTCTVKMGKPTDLEDAYEMLFGGDDE